MLGLKKNPSFVALLLKVLLLKASNEFAKKGDLNKHLGKFFLSKATMKMFDVFNPLESFQLETNKAGRSKS